jgi:acyl-CoA thioesterase
MMAENRGVDEALFQYLVHSIKESPFYNLLGLELKSVDSGEVKISVVTDEKHTNPIGLIHGGLIMTMADAAMGNAIRSLGIKGVTIDCSTAYPASAPKGTELIATGKVLRAGKTLIFAEALVLAGEKLIGHSKATFYRTDLVELYKPEGK